MFRKLGKILTNRIFIFFLIVLIELGLLTFLIYFINKGSPYFYAFFILISILCLFEVIGRNTSLEYKIAWVIVITCLPGFGFIFYLFLGRKVISKHKKEQYLTSNKKFYSYLTQNTNVDDLIKNDQIIRKCANFVKNESNFPAYQLENCKFLPTGECFYNELLKELNKAEKFIFLEYYIIKPGFMWKNILEILKNKAKEGVEIRIIYDDFGSILTLPRRYPKQLAKFGIKSMRFNRIIPILDARFNIRNHRKITIIDGKTAFVGGSNIGDEYINKESPLGHWKDCAVVFYGEAVNSYTISVLQTWAAQFGFEDPSQYLIKTSNMNNSNDIIIPFYDSPLLNSTICENLLLNLIYSAKQEINITTPYLILNSELKSALISASQMGINVNIIIPHKPDKKSIYQLTKAFCAELIKAKISIYEYLPGFIHSKILTIDNNYAIVGTSNLDIRSLRTNYECGVLLKSKSIVNDITKDIKESISISKKITMLKKPNIFIRAYRSILRILAPLM